MYPNLWSAAADLVEMMHRTAGDAGEIKNNEERMERAHGLPPDRNARRKESGKWEHHDSIACPRTWR